MKARRRTWPGPLQDDAEKRLKKSRLIAALALAMLVGAIPPVLAQFIPGPVPGSTSKRPVFPPRFPTHKVDPAAVERGKALFTSNGCSFCHGADAAGGDGGPSLRRSGVVLRDQQGESIGKIVKNGVPGTAMAAFKLTDAQIADVAQFLHSFVIGGTGTTHRPKTIVVGDASAGRSYFQAHCARCHSPSGDLAGFAAKFPDPVDLQQAWLAPDAKSPPRATIRLADGSRVSGQLTRLDEFSVAVATPQGERSFAREGGEPKIHIDYPLQYHSDMLRFLTDTEIHDVTAYLVTLK